VDPRNTTELSVAEYVLHNAEMLPITTEKLGGRYKAVFGRRRRIGGKPVTRPVGERGVGAVIAFFVTIGRRRNLPAFIQAATEAAVRTYRECCAKAGRRAVGWHTWTNPVPVPESAARLTALYEAFEPTVAAALNRNGCPHPDHAPAAALGPGAGESPWLDWSGIKPWVFSSLRCRDEKDERESDGHPPRGSKHRLVYGAPHLKRRDAG
jgi:hypothetical protein